jgi:hypothetical protein
METKAEAIRQLVKEWLETGDDHFLDALEHVTHDAVDFNKVFNRVILEDYIQTRLKLHLHIIRLGEVGFYPDVCAISQHRLGSYGRIVQDSPSGGIGDVQVGLVGENRGHGERAVLIDVHELTQTPEGMSVGRHLPNVVRLQTLDDCLRLNGHPTESVARNLPIVTIGRPANREHVFLNGGSVVNKHQLPDDMIKCGTKVMQALANDDAELRVGSGQDKIEVEDPFFIRVALGSNAALVQAAFHHLPYRCEMFFSPDDFLPNAV